MGVSGYRAQGYMVWGRAGVSRAHGFKKVLSVVRKVSAIPTAWPATLDVLRFGCSRLDQPRIPIYQD